MPRDPILALRDLVEDELVALERVANETVAALASFSNQPTQLEMHGLASYLHQFYTGIESILERIVVRMGEGLPRGEHWHADLLNQMAKAQPGKRPAVIDGPLHARLKDYLNFRHFFRHAYGYTLEWNRMRWEAENMPETLAVLREQLHIFFQVVTGGAEKNNDNSH